MWNSGLCGSKPSLLLITIPLPGEMLPFGDFECELHVFLTYNFGNVGRCRFSGNFLPGIVSIGGGIGFVSWS